MLAILVMVLVAILIALAVTRLRSTDGDAAVGEGVAPSWASPAEPSSELPPSEPATRSSAESTPRALIALSFPCEGPGLEESAAVLDEMVGSLAIAD